MPDVADHEQRLPPHSIEAEMCVLGSMVLDPEAISIVVPLVRKESFYRPDHQTLYDVLVQMYAAGEQREKIDLITLREKLKDLDLLEKIGGVPYLVALTESVSSAANVEHYAHVVRRHALLREMIRAAGEITRDAYAGAARAEEVLDEAERRIMQIAEERIVTDPVRITGLLEDAFDRLHRQEGQRVTGLPTAFDELDTMTSGLQPGELVIIAGRPSMGKTAFALNVAEHIASVEREPVAFFSLEMSAQQLVQRMLCTRAGVDAQSLRTGSLGPERVKKLKVASEALEEAPFFIDDSVRLTPLDLRAKARRLKHREGIRCVFVDYLQLMDGSGTSRRESRQQEITDISRSLKALARELSIPVVALSQLNRAPEGREGHRPRMSDLRESGAIEQDADVVMMLHREEYYNPDDPEAKGKAELIIAKQRNGPTGTVKLAFLDRFTRFGNLSRLDADDVGFAPPSGYEEPLEPVDELAVYQ